MSATVQRRPFDVTIDGTKYRVDTAKYVRQSIPPVRPQVDQGNKDTEGSLSNVGFWRRSQQSFTGGAGQEWLDQADSSPERFWCSVGLDPFTKIGVLSQYQQLTQRSTLVAGDTTSWQGIHPLGTRLGWVLNGFVRYSGVAEFLSPSWTAVAVAATTVHSCSDGGDTISYVYGANANGGGYMTATGLTHTAWAGALAGSAWTMVASAAGRTFVGTSAGKLRELDATPQIETTGMLQYQHRSATFQWVGACAGSDGIYFWGNTKRVSQILKATYDAATGLLQPPLVVAEFVNEVVLCAAFVGDVMFIGTTKGFRCAQLSRVIGVSGLTLSYGPLVRHNRWLKTNKSQGVASCAVDGSHVVFAWGSQGTPATGVEVTGLGRANMANFTRPLVPAYVAAEPIANSAFSITSSYPNVNRGDICSICIVAGYPFVVTGYGPSAQATVERNFTYPPGGVGTSVDNVGTVIARNPVTTAPAGATAYCPIGPDDARTLYDSAKFVSSGITWGIADDKVPVLLDVHTDPLVGGELAVQLEKEDLTPVTVGYINTVGSRGTDAPTLIPTAARLSAKAHTVGMVFRSSTTAPAVGPVLSAWALFANPNPVAAEEIIVPLVLAPDVQARTSSHRTSSPWDVFQQFKTWEGDGTLVEYVEGDQKMTVRVDSCQLADVEFEDRQNWWHGTLTVRLVTVVPTGTLGTWQATSANAGDASSPSLGWDDSTTGFDGNYQFD